MLIPCCDFFIASEEALKMTVESKPVGLIDNKENTTRR